MIDSDGNVVCDKCNKHLLQGDWPFCPHEKNTSYNVIGDECDVWIRHGICNEDGSPRHYTSKEAMRKEAERRGVTNVVRHIGENGSDKSRWTTKWT